MFGLIRKKKVKDALVAIAKEYDNDKQQPGMTKLNSFYYSCGNMNCANYIAHKLGIDAKVRVKR